MIQANELRIGNWIAVKGVPVLVDNINDAGINGVFDSHWAEYGTEEIDPIPLTPEILQAVGFEEDNLRCWSRGILTLDVFTDYRRWYFIDGVTKIEITSLHQLQNLYFALTGQELIYKP